MHEAAVKLGKAMHPLMDALGFAPQQLSEASQRNAGADKSSTLADGVIIETVADPPCLERRAGAVRPPQEPVAALVIVDHRLKGIYFPRRAVKPLMLASADVPGDGQKIGDQPQE